MRRYEFRSPGGTYEVAVGWDEPFGTFVAQAAPRLDCDCFGLRLWAAVTNQDIGQALAVEQDIEHDFEL